MDVRRCLRMPPGGTIWTDPPTDIGVQSMTLTPGLTLLGLLLVLLSIPLAFSFGPFVIGVIVLVFAARRAHRGLATGEPTFAAV